MKVTGKGCNVSGQKTDLIHYESNEVPVLRETVHYNHNCGFANGGGQAINEVHGNVGSNLRRNGNGCKRPASLV
jgi:hypothetical protein